MCLTARVTKECQLHRDSLKLRACNRFCSSVWWKTINWAGWKAKTGSCITVPAHLAHLHLICKKSLNLQETKSLSCINSQIFSTSAILPGNLLNKLRATNHSIGGKTYIGFFITLTAIYNLCMLHWKTGKTTVQLDTVILTYRLINSSTRLFWLASMSDFKVHWPHISGTKVINQTPLRISYSFQDWCQIKMTVLLVPQLLSLAKSPVLVRQIWLWRSHAINSTKFQGQLLKS